MPDTDATVETLDDLNSLAIEWERKGYRIRYISVAGDSLDYSYAPTLTNDGAKEADIADLKRKAEIAGKLRGWTDITVVGPDLQPLVAPTVEQVVNAAVKSNPQQLEQPSVDEILANARIVPEVKGMPPYIPEEEDKLQKAVNRVAAMTGYPPLRLMRLAREEGVDDVENLDDALNELVKGALAAA